MKLLKVKTITVNNNEGWGLVYEIRHMTKEPLFIVELTHEEYDKTVEALKEKKKKR